MTKPYPCNQCACNSCTDWSQPWYLQCCNWFAQPAHLKNYLDGLIVNFGVITPVLTTGIAQSVPPAGASSDNFYGRSTVDVGYDHTFTSIPAFLRKFSLGTPIDFTPGTISYRIHEVKITLHWLYRGPASLNCKRSYRISVAMKVALQSYDFGGGTEELQADGASNVVDGTVFQPDPRADSGKEFGSSSPYSVTMDYPRDYSRPATGCGEHSSVFTPRPPRFTTSNTRLLNRFVGRHTWELLNCPDGFGRRIEIDQTSSSPIPYWSTFEDDTGATPSVQNWVTNLPAIFEYPTHDIPYNFSNPYYRIQRSSIFPSCEAPPES